MMGLTAKQRALYDFIAARIAESGIAPSCEEMARGTGTSSKGEIHRVLGMLEKRGAIRRMYHRARAIEIIPQDGPADAVTLHPEVRRAVTDYARRNGISFSAAMSEGARAYFLGDK